MALEAGCSFPSDEADPADEPHRRCSCSVSHLRDAARVVGWPASFHRASLPRSIAPSPLARKSCSVALQRRLRLWHGNATGAGGGC
eukprot:scaffold34767_cov57-Phaeocystis_antarctica.AAC.1